ncbi:MAG TPA: hypothetical protein PLY06_01185 [Anaerolineaceae bacterium]|jgi:hypothetical protein|nr:hypothetical protein [Chloroflexota bacterium]HOF27949.1 hypothetical protein [Anaerolineaceae bacterium]
MGIKTTENGTTLRNRLMKSIVLAIRTLMQQGSPDKRSLDMAAYIVLALGKIDETINTAAVAWEKRDYWVKADQFRQEWAWIDPSQTRLKAAVLAQNWAEIGTEVVLVGQHLSKVQIAEKNRIGEPWVGAWEALRRTNN